ncbi:acyltransferase [Tardiphaga alba]|uniref:Acyltransferase n=1 Tax=Tardiphaga alba TaxID=340268 RepID=A0ABX8AB95_9BRAD|nr:acyltransferase [Tardiphaga alba]QUS40566.1 acyltransferase [Tardiphaga alba]
MQIHKLAGLDALRGVAIALVIAAHFMPPQLPYAVEASVMVANAGVILFFILSGYLMDRNLAANDAIGQYAIRRAFRILPVYWLSIALIAATSSAWTIGQAVTNATFIAPLFGAERMSGVYWTLYIEVAFYAAAPVLRWMGEKAIRIAPFLFAIAVLAFWSIRGLIVIAPMYLIFCLLGMLIGSLHRGGQFRWLDAFIALRARPLEVIGHVSYSWYLLHTIVGYPILRAAYAATDQWWIASSIGIAVSFLVSLIVHRYFEKPIIELGRRAANTMDSDRGRTRASG